MKPSRLGLGAVVLALAVAGCGSGGHSGAAAPTVPTAPPAPTCPAPTATPLQAWPVGVPADLPKPPGARLESATIEAGNLHVTRFSTPTSLRDGVLFVLQHLQKAGFVLGRGDAEAGEADVPFARGDVHAAMRLVEAAACRTEWLLVTTRVFTSGPGLTLLPSHTPSGSPSPLPFGVP